MEHKFFLFTVLLTSVLLTGCKDNSFIDNPIIRRLRFRNQPELVAQDFAEALQNGGVYNLFALSTESVESKLCNELALASADPDIETPVLLERYSGDLKKKYEDTTVIIEKLPGKVATEDTYGFLLIFRKKDGTESKLTIHLVRNKSGNWKNTTRL